MFLPILRSISRLSARCQRLCSCWCPEEPFDPNTRVTYLPNGVRVMTEENYSPLTCVSLFVIAGSRYETANCNGLTHFIEHLVYKGFKSMSRCDLENSVFCSGARMTAKTRRDMQMFSVLIPSQCAAEAVNYLSKILTEVNFDDCELEAERYNMCLELLDADNDPKTTMFDYLHATAFQGTSLAQPVIGPMRNQATFDKPTTASFFCEHYSTCRLILAASGGVLHDEILGAASGTFGCLTPGGDWDADAGHHRFTSSEVIYRNDSMPFAHIAIAFEAPGYNSPNYLTMLVMSCLLGSWDKSQGRSDSQSFYVARGAEVGHCQSYESFYITYKDVGLWGVYFVADKYKLDDMVLIIQEAWMQMSVMNHSYEIEKAVNLAKLKVARRYEGVVNSCRDMGTQMMYACRRRSYETLKEQIQVVQPFMVREMAQEYLYNRGPAVVGIGPTESLPEYSRTLAGMYWLRW